MNTDLAWPPAYTIKKHPKAKGVKLRISKHQGLMITVPYRFNPAEIPAVLAQHKSWISKQLLRIAATQSHELPEQITLQACNETWKIHYLSCEAKLELIQRPEKEIVLVGRQDKEKSKLLLMTWLKQQAKQKLIPHLHAVSQALQLPYAEVAIRDQLTLWGSCTPQKHISLNYKLIFLPFSLVTHVLIHELCHTKYLNHSKKFWDLVALHDASWQQHRLALRRADQFIPHWI